MTAKTAKTLKTSNTKSTTSPVSNSDSFTHVGPGFKPVFDARSRVLILGSFPSVASRQQGFFYGNPHNRFWQVMFAILGMPGAPSSVDEPAALASFAAALTIPQKKQLLLDAGIALWDVVESCDIRGSSDTSIRNAIPADIARILNVSPISRVIANGQTAGRLYHLYLEPVTGQAATVLPSTSPANAAYSLKRLVEVWEEALRA